MTRKIYIVSPVAVVAVAAVAAAALLFTDGGSNAESMSALADQIRAQTDATRAAVALANDIWVPRVAGVGVGLAGGLLAGGVGAYTKRGDGR